VNPAFQLYAAERLVFLEQLDRLIAVEDRQRIDRVAEVRQAGHVHDVGNLRLHADKDALAAVLPEPLVDADDDPEREAGHEFDGGTSSTSDEPGAANNATSSPC
jgi:hypothetical protein